MAAKPCVHWVCSGWWDRMSHLTVSPDSNVTKVQGQQNDLLCGSHGQVGVVDPRLKFQLVVGSQSACQGTARNDLVWGQQLSVAT